MNNRLDIRKWFMVLYLPDARYARPPGRIGGLLGIMLELLQVVDVELLT